MLGRFSFLSDDEVEEVAMRAWQNVAAHSTEYSPLAILASLAEVSSLPTEQLEFLASAHFVMSEEVGTLINAAERIVKRLSQTTSLEEMEGRVPVGYIDWPATALRRITGRSDRSQFVLRKTELHRDVPENRLLRYALAEVEHHARNVLTSQPIEGWRRQVETVRSKARELYNHQLLRTIPSEHRRQGYLAARTSRTPGYRDVARAIALSNGLFRAGDQSVLLELFRQHVLMPELEERAFELLVLFRLLDYLESVGAQRVAIRLIGRGVGPVFIYLLDGRLCEVYFQNPSRALANHSFYRKISESAGLGTPGLRPDIVVRIAIDETEQRTVILEAKCSTNLNTIRDGIFQLIGYFGDFQLYQANAPMIVLVVYGGLPDDQKIPSHLSLATLSASVTDLPRLKQALASVAF